jgi:hypothetical protein
MAFDPLAAIKQPSQRPKLAFDPGTEGILDGVDSSHLIGNRTDAADPRHDVGQFGKATAAQEGLEEARRLEDSKGCRRDPAIGRADRPECF